MDWLKSEWLKITLGLIYAVLTAAVLMAMGNIADNINSKADKSELKQEIELVKKDFEPVYNEIRILHKSDTELKQKDKDLEQLNKDTRIEYLKAVEGLRQDILDLWKSKN